MIILNHCLALWKTVLVFPPVSACPGPEVRGGGTVYRSGRLY